MINKKEQLRVAIVGRTNVGKSTLFNRLIGLKKAITSNIAGTTRDRNIGIANWNNLDFELIDTGGLDVSYLSQSRIPKNLLKNPSNLSALDKDIIKQAQIAINQADLILMVIDGQVGVMNYDKTVVNLLRKNGKPFLLVVNKIDTQKFTREKAEWLKLGETKYFPVSGKTGYGTGDLLDEVVKYLKTAKQPAPAPANFSAKEIRISIVGKPNVGKSSLLNAILGENRVIVNEAAHTTREAHDEIFGYGEHLFRVIDTAGIRKKSKVSKGLEKLGVIKSLTAIKESDIALLVVESNTEISVQDKHISEQLINAKNGIIIIANKWDMVPNKDTHTQEKITAYLRHYFPYLTWAPVIFVSAKTGFHVPKILDLILKVWEQKNISLTDAQLDYFIHKTVKKHRPTKGRGTKHPYIYALKQTSNDPPRFHLVIDRKSDLHFSYIRFLENRLRETYGFTGVPISIETKRID